jgi:hypothetical protein
MVSIWWFTNSCTSRSNKRSRHSDPRCEDCNRATRLNPVIPKPGGCSTSVLTLGLKESKNWPRAVPGKARTPRTTRAAPPRNEARRSLR